MTILVMALHFISAFAAAIIAGGQLLVLMVIVPVKRVLSARMSVQIHVAMLGHQTDRYMKPVGLICGFSGLMLLALPPEHTLVNMALLAVGLLGMLGVVITSRYFNVRTNLEMEQWSLDALPMDYDRWRNRWDQVHAIRTAAGLAALFGFLASGLAH